MSSTKINQIELSCITDPSGGESLKKLISEIEDIRNSNIIIHKTTDNREVKGGSEIVIAATVIAYTVKSIGPQLINFIVTWYQRPGEKKLIIKRKLSDGKIEVIDFSGSNITSNELSNAVKSFLFNNDKGEKSE